MQTNPLLEQLDWFFTSVDWTTQYPNTIVKPLAKYIYDHTPCVVNIQTSIPRATIFRFENFWAEHPGFSEVVDFAWNTNCQSQNSATGITTKFNFFSSKMLELE